MSCHVVNIRSHARVYTDSVLITGLCGTWDGDITNELTKMDGVLDSETGRRPNVFIETWRWVSIYNCCSVVLNMHNHLNVNGNL